MVAVILLSFLLGNLVNGRIMPSYTSTFEHIFSDGTNVTVFVGEDGFLRIDDCRIVGTVDTGVVIDNFFRRRLSPVSTDEQYRWPNNIVPYEIDPNYPGLLSERFLALFQEAIDEYSLKTTITIRPKVDTDSHWVKIVEGSGCSSWLGRDTTITPQVITLESEGCWHKGVIIHEFGHALGMHHTQQRADRDDHIDIILDNVNPEYHFTYSKYLDNSFTLCNTYDCSSNMHYGNGAFAISPGLDTIIAKDPSTCVISNPGELSIGDVQCIDYMYGETYIPYIYQQGYLSIGNNIEIKTMTINEAKAYAYFLPNCIGFTAVKTISLDQPTTIWFKSKKEFGFSNEWQTYIIPKYTIENGFLAGGNDILSKTMSINEAIKFALVLKDCTGFTFLNENDRDIPITIHFARSVTQVHASNEWTTYLFDNENEE